MRSLQGTITHVELILPQHCFDYDAIYIFSEWSKLYSLGFFMIQIYVYVMFGIGKAAPHHSL